MRSQHQPQQHQHPQITAKTVDYVQRTVRTILGSHEDCEDIAQSALVNIVQRLKSYRQKSSFNTWVYTVVQSTVSDHFRHLGRKGRDSARVELKEYDEPDFQMLACLELQSVVQALDSVDPGTARMFWQYYAEGMSTTDIAKCHGMSEPAVKARIHRAHHKVLETA